MSRKVKKNYDKNLKRMNWRGEIARIFKLSKFENKHSC